MTRIDESTYQISIMESSQATQNGQLIHPQTLCGSEKHWKKYLEYNKI